MERGKARIYCIGTDGLFSHISIELKSPTSWRREGARGRLPPRAVYEGAINFTTSIKKIYAPSPT